MKKTWLILFCASILFICLKYFIPRDIILNQFSKNSDSQFDKTLKEQANDTINRQRVIDSLAAVEKKRIADFKGKERRKHDSIQKVIKDKRDNRNGLNDFFHKLHDLEKDDTKQIRIAVFGDSMIEGDLIIMQLRNLLQEKFGGQGVGYVPINSISAKGRYTIKQRFKGDWHEYSFMKKGFKSFPFGLNGKTFYVGDKDHTKTASVTYKRGSAYKNLPLINPILFYGRPKREKINKIKIDSVTESKSDTLTKSKTDSILKETKAYYIIKNKRKDTLKHPIRLKKSKLLNSYKLPLSPNKFEITVKDHNTTPFYGVSFASKNGIIIDNLALRANSGLPISKLNINLMQQFDNHFNYDLIIIAYGTNAFSFKHKKYDWYKRGMVKNIKHLQKCFPHADFLVSSMADRSQKIETKMQTPKHLPDFIKAQNEIAKETKSGFFNLYKQMGGENSMVKWVEDGCAAKDYTHLSSKGGRKAAKLIFKWLMTNYKEVKSQFKKRKKKKKKKIKKVKKVKKKSK